MVGGSIHLLELLVLVDVVQAKDVVRVGVGDQHGIDARQGVLQGLLAEVRGGVDQQPEPVMPEVDAGAQPPVARICRSADGAVAADQGHAGGGAGAEKERFGRGVGADGGHGAEVLGGAGAWAQRARGSKGRS